MQVISDEQIPNRDADGLLRFFSLCQERARQDGECVYASISLRVKHIDPLAVLQSIDEPDAMHAYAECLQQDYAVAAAEAVTSQSCQGDARFSQLRAFSDRVLSRCLAIGDLDAPFSGPHLFCSVPFAADEADTQIFLPRWQVGVRGGEYTAVANASVGADTDLEQLTQKILAAHGKFSRFDYRADSIGVPSATGSSTHMATRMRLGEPIDAGRDYRQIVREGLKDIADGLYEKIVLARAVDLPLEGELSPLDWLSRLREAYPNCHALSFKSGFNGSFIAATPEKLLSVHDRQLRTEAIAGSAPRGEQAREDARLASALLASEKNLREHAAVVDSIRERLNEAGLEVCVASQPRLLKLANVQHLWTPITATLPETTHLLSIAERLHPTPAVGGRPRQAVSARIRELEGFPRDGFAGLVGWLDHRGDGELLVGLRSAQVTPNQLRLYAGAGIVAGSDPDAELAETDLKLQALRKTLQLT